MYKNQPRSPLGGWDGRSAQQLASAHAEALRDGVNMHVVQVQVPETRIDPTSERGMVGHKTTAFEHELGLSQQSSHSKMHSPEHRAVVPHRKVSNTAPTDHTGTAISCALCLCVHRLQTSTTSKGSRAGHSPSMGRVNDAHGQASARSGREVVLPPPQLHAASPIHSNRGAGALRRPLAAVETASSPHLDAMLRRQEEVMRNTRQRSRDVSAAEYGSHGGAAAAGGDEGGGAGRYALTVGHVHNVDTPFARGAGGEGAAASGGGGGGEGGGGGGGGSTGRGSPVTNIINEANSHAGGRVSPGGALSATPSFKLGRANETTFDSPLFRAHSSSRFHLKPSNATVVLRSPTQTVVRRKVKRHRSKASNSATPRSTTEPTTT